MMSITRKMITTPSIKMSVPDDYTSDDNVDDEDNDENDSGDDCGCEDDVINWLH